MITKNGITVEHVTETEAYDIFKITGIQSEDEKDNYVYVEERRGAYSEEDVINEYTDY